MRFMVLVKADVNSEAGVMPGEEMLAAMGRFNEELARAGVLQAGEGLHPSSRGVRVRFSGEQRSVTKGPFAPTNELVAGFWIWKCASLEEAVEWARRCPNPMPGDSDLEIRPIFEAEDFGEALTPQLREQEDRLRVQVAAQQQPQPWHAADEVPKRSNAPIGTHSLTGSGAATGMPPIGGDADALADRAVADEKAARERGEPDLTVEPRAQRGDLLGRK